MAVAWLAADWAAPANVRAGTTLRGGGVSTGACATLNLAAHVGDDPEAVQENRRRFAAACGLPSEPLWLEQVHGTRVAPIVRAPPIPNGRAGGPSAPPSSSPEPPRRSPGSVRVPC